MSKLFDHLAEVEERRGQPLHIFDDRESLIWNLRNSREDVEVLVRIVKSITRDCAKYVYGRVAIEKAERLLPEKK